MKKKKVACYKRFFGKRFFGLAKSSISLSADSEERKMAEIALRKTYASNKTVAFLPIKWDAKGKRVRAEIQEILAIEGEKALLLKFFFEKFLNREVG